MTIVQEFGSWWFQNVFDPYGRFVYVENLGWATIFVAVVTTILLGLFYKPSEYSIHSKFMERYGFPLAILTVVTIVMPTLSVVLMLIMPGIIVIGGGIGILFGLFVWLQKVRERHILEEIWRLMVQKKGENE
jgi:phosphotransferase system  glucose/maltose/N-acetylglucosamine-specific IIC component